MVAKVAPLVVIVGETASGKSDLAMQLANEYNGEIICADSRTIYKGMDIGTAKPSQEDQARVPHYLLDMIEPDQNYNAAQFKTEADRLIDDISKQDKLAIMVGGSGLYIDSVIFNYQFTDADAPRDPLNPRHLLKPVSSSEVSTNLQRLRPDTLVIGLKLEREVLEQRIKARVEQMVENGLVEEVKTLIKKYGAQTIEQIGICYKPFSQYVRGEIDLDEAKAQFVKGDLYLAKKQRTWFKRNKYIQWIDNPEEAQSLVQTFLTRVE